MKAAPPEVPAWVSHRLDEQIIECMVAEDPARLRELSRTGIAEASIRARARALGITGEFIKRCRLSGSRAAMRVCINCDVKFLSSGIHNRICNRCRPR